MYKGQLQGFPKEVVEKMLEHQVAQGNKRDVSVFEKNKVVGSSRGQALGFDWNKAPEGHGFWEKVILLRRFDLFFEKYPKQNEYPKVMMVSDSPITIKNPGVPRVVFAEKCDKYIAWAGAKTLEEAETEWETYVWKYAQDIPEEPEEIEVSLEDISKAMNIPIDKLRIKK